MESSQTQKDKLELIEWITQIDDTNLLDKLKAMMAEAENSSFQLSKEQQLIIEETAEKYHSEKEHGYTWEEVKSNAEDLKKAINEKKA